MSERSAGRGGGKNLLASAWAFRSLSVVVSDSDTLIAGSCGRSGGFPAFVLAHFASAQSFSGFLEALSTWFRQRCMRFFCSCFLSRCWALLYATRCSSVGSLSYALLLRLDSRISSVHSGDHSGREYFVGLDQGTYWSTAFWTISVRRWKAWSISEVLWRFTGTWWR